MKTRKLVDAGRECDRTHTEVQAWLRDLGRALGFSVHVAANDRGRPWDFAANQFRRLLSSLTYVVVESLRSLGLSG
ncbi:MAG: hypothetical protein HYX46_05055 [Betaproteobacteria bacterium]|nr:hypothetical protein [Betaproteobacteria bacterium]